MSIENPTLAHFRHFSSLFTNLPSTTVEDSLQISPFMQNKANFQKSQMNVNKVLTKDYENIANWTLGENKPNQTQFPKSTNECKLTYNKGLQKKRRFRSPKKQTQFKANFRKAKMNVNLYVIKEYENETTFRVLENKPNQTQFHPHRLCACFNFLLWEVVRRKLCCLRVYLGNVG